jgi:hypothetical protein
MAVCSNSLIDDNIIRYLAYKFLTFCFVIVVACSQAAADLTQKQNIGPCHVSGIFLPLRVNSLPLATIYEVKIPLRKWKKSLLQRNPAQMTWHIDSCCC